jgi:hypothetical protein
MTNLSTHDLPLAEAILLDTRFIITQINGWTSLSESIFVQAEYSAIEKLIRAKRIEELKVFIKKNDKEVQGFCEYLSIMSFTDQNDREYVVTIYDNDELWHDPEIIDIYPQ